MNKTLVIAAVLIIAIVGGYSLFKRNNGNESNLSTTTTPTLTPTQIPENDTITPMDGSDQLIIEDLKLGTGVEAISGKKVTVNYKGTLTNGVQFDSSYDRGEPFSFTLGAGQVIEGWDKGVAGMKIGGKRKLTIPASLGYGQQEVGQIPADSTLIFEIELLKVE